VPDDASPAERRVYAFMAIAYPLSLVVHFLYIFLFAAWEVWPMAIFNIVGMILWLSGTVFLRRQRLTPALAIPFFELLAHHSLVIVFFGWGFGAQYLVFVRFIGVILIANWPRWVNVTLAALAMLFFIGWYYYTVFFPPLASAPPLQLAVVNILNIAATFVMAGVSTAYLVTEADRAEQTNEELLNNVLPQSIAARLKKKEPTIADGFQNASILFADLTGFTRLSLKL
jgi:hypothetical protein